MKKQLRITRLAGALAVLLATAPVYAQNTSANLSGRVTTADGAPLSGADITIVHTPSGTTSRATTDAEGRYNARGLRVGGPYTVTIQRDGYQGEASENVFLLLGETSALNADLDTTATELGSIEVVAGTASSIFTPDKMGTGTNITRDLTGITMVPEPHGHSPAIARISVDFPEPDSPRIKIFSPHSITASAPLITIRPLCCSTERPTRRSRASSPSRTSI